MAAGSDVGSAAGSADGSAAGSGSSAGAGSAEAAGSAAATGKEPKVTPDMVLADKAKWKVEAKERGLWLGIGKRPLEHACGADLNKELAKLGKVRKTAQGLQKDPEFMDPTSCAPTGGFTVCNYTHPMPDPEADPTTMTSWVFTGTDAAPILVAVLYGETGDLGPILTKLAKVEPCK
jgi:hypothetical protein